MGLGPDALFFGQEGVVMVEFAFFVAAECLLADEAIDEGADGFGIP